MADSKEGIDPIQVLTDELKNEDVQLRLNSLRQISTIAQAIGQERTRNELVPFLAEATDDEDEVLLVLAEELGNLIEFVGGSEYAHKILQPLQNLASVEETVVREKCVESIVKIARELEEEQIQDYLHPLLKTLSEGEWFTSRSSACGLFAVTYQSVDDKSKAELRKTFAKLCGDETPMVRRAAAQNLASFVPHIELEFLVSEFVPLFTKLSKDEQDNVRLFAVDNCVSLAKVFQTEDETLTHVLPVFKATISDKSWRVRYMASEKFCQFCESLGPELTKQHLVESFVDLLKDYEAEIRTSATLKIAEFCSRIRIFREVIIEKIMPVIKELRNDISDHVKAALASSVTALAPVIGKDDSVKFLVPLYLDLLKEDIPEVKINIVSKLDSVTQVIGIEVLASSILPAIVELTDDRQWRVRMSMIEFIPSLAIQLGVEFFDEKLVELCRTWLMDSVYKIREIAAKNLKRLTESFGTEWFQSTMMPKVVDLLKHKNYLFRQIAMYTFTTLAPELGTEFLTKSVLPEITKLKTDSVANVKMFLAKTLQSLIPYLEENTIQTDVKSCLSELSKSDDNDVKSYANQALSKCS